MPRQPNPIQPMPPGASGNGSKVAKRSALAALVGTCCAAILYVTVPREEGTEYRAYRDVVGVLTICTGDTRDVHSGQVATKADCEERLTRQLIAHARPILACVPELSESGRDYQRAASVSLAYNIGPTGFCRSTVARKFRAHDWRGGCNAFLAWDKAGGRTITGLHNRRVRERAICLTGLS